MKPSQHEKQESPRWYTNPNNRPRCPQHNVRLIAFAGRGVVGLCRCPVAGCSHRQKVARVQVRG
jgi:hypothetical protein